MVIHDDDVALSGAPSHLGDEAAVVLFAFLAEASVGAGIEFVPKRACLGQFGEFCAVAGVRGLFPGGDRLIVFDLFEAAQDGLVSQVVELFSAEIIVAALHVADGKLSLAVGRERALQKRHVFEVKLLLQIFRAGRDDDALAGANDGQQIGERFSSTGAGFSDQMALFFQRLLHRLGHLELSAAEFIGGMTLRQNSARREELVERDSGGGGGMGGRRHRVSIIANQLPAASCR